MINYDYLRPKKTETIKKWYEKEFIKRDDLTACMYNNAIILPVKRFSGDDLLFGRGGVVCNDSYIEASGIDGRFGGYYEYLKPIESQEAVVYCGYLMKHWGHFLLESISRLWYFLENKNVVDKYVFCVEEGSNTDISGNYKEFFDLLGVSNKIEIISSATRYKKVIIPELGYSRDNYYSEQFKEMLNIVIENALIKCQLKERSKKIFFSRSKFPKAKKTEIGVEMLDNYFINNGFKVIYPEKIKLSDMIYYINNAEVCATSSGTLAHNFLFAQDMKNVIIVERQACINEYQVNVDRIRNLSVIYIDGHYTIKPAKIGSGPFFFAFNNCFEKYTKANNYKEPDNYYLSEKWIKKCLRRFLKTHELFYGYTWGIEKWQLMYSDLMYESYEDSLVHLNPYLIGQKPFFFYHLFELKYIKQFIKRMLLKK